MELLGKLLPGLSRQGLSPGVVNSAPRFAHTFDSQVGGLAPLSLGKARPPREALIGSVELHAAGLAKM